MTDRSTLGILWHGRRIIIAVFLVFVVVAGVVSKLLPKVYSASSTLIVIGDKEAATFDAVQAAEVTARSYSDIIGTSKIATLVAESLRGGETASSISSSVSVSPVVETQLLRITATNRSPVRAQQIANFYANVTIEYAHKYLGSNAGASLALASSATRPEAPSRPRPTLYVLVAAVLGLFFGIGGAFLLERLDTRLRTADEVRSRFKQVILTRVPRRGVGDISINAFNEAFGLLRTNLQFAVPGGAPKVIAVTSAREAEGKTTCVTNMAYAMADAGSRIAVVDADLRRSALQARVMPEIDKPLRPGICNYLDGDCSLEEIIYDTDRPNVSLVPTGPSPANPAAFLESHGLRSTLRELSEQFDFVIVDCPPMFAGADASIVGTRVDGVMVVVNLARSDERILGEVLRQLETVHASVLGFVLNEDTATALTYDYQYAAQTS